MGLDITAYSRLKDVTHPLDGDWCQDEDHIRAFAYDSFPASFRGLPIIGRSSGVGPGLLLGVRDGFLWGGCYAVTDETRMERDSFSYSGYNGWRDDLRRQFNPDTEPDLPFYELIWFADNEGTIGPEAAADLATDFREHAERYRPDFDFEAPDDWGKRHYALLTVAFELAADGGLVDFH